LTVLAADGYSGRSLRLVFYGGQVTAWSRSSRRQQHPGNTRCRPTHLFHYRRYLTVRTYSPKPGDVQRQWYIIDAEDVVLGRLASQVAQLLRGKHKPVFAPHSDTGDFVVVINAAKVSLSGNKREQKLAYHHSGYPGGLRATNYTVLLEKNPRRAIEKAVWGMLPKNRIARQQLKKLKVYAGPEHPHQAQQPVPFEIVQVAQ